MSESLQDNQLFDITFRVSTIFTAQFLRYKLLSIVALND